MVIETSSKYARLAVAAGDRRIKVPTRSDLFAAQS